MLEVQELHNVATVGCDEPAVRGENEFHSLGKIGERKPALVLAKAPKVAPLPAPQVRGAWSWQVRPKQSLRVLEIPFLPELLNQVHVGGVSVNLCLLTGV